LFYPRYQRLLWAVFLFFLLVLPPSLNASAETNENSPWSIFLYGGRWSSNRIGEIIQGRTEFAASNVYAIGLARTLRHLTRDLILEGEKNIALHSGKQSHPEVNATLSLRYKSFPWDDWINTSLAYGLGVSYAFSPPAVEEKPDKSPSRILIFMPVELTFAPSPRTTQSTWESFLRIHHRSGAYGVVSDARGSNFITGGVRYRF